MEHLIDKDALVAEIERLKNDAHNGVSYHQSRQSVGLINELSTWEHLENAFLKVLKIIDSFEVKEVDLEKELESWRHNHFHGRRDKESSGEYLERVNQLNLAKHFFELGMAVSNNALKGEDI